MKTLVVAMIIFWPLLIVAQEVRTAGNPCESRGYVSAQLKRAYEEIMKQRLKAPTTAKFDKFTATLATAKDTMCIWDMTAAVTSQNSFGAMLTETMSLMLGCESTKQFCASITIK